LDDQRPADKKIETAFADWFVLVEDLDDLLAFMDDPSKAGIRRQEHPHTPLPETPGQDDDGPRSPRQSPDEPTHPILAQARSCLFLLFPPLLPPWRPWRLGG